MLFTIRCDTYSTSIQHTETEMFKYKMKIASLKDLIEIEKTRLNSYSHSDKAAKNIKVYMNSIYKCNLYIIDCKSKIKTLKAKQNEE